MKLQNIWGRNPEENYFRRKINLDKMADTAFLRIFVDTGYELFINGRFVARVAELCNTRDYNVRQFLRRGENLFAIYASNRSGHRGLALELAVDGKSVLVSDSSWKVFQEERWGWMLNEFDDVSWEFARIMDMSCAGSPQWRSFPGSDPDKIIPALDCSPFFQNEIPKAVDSPFFTAKHPVDWKPSPEASEIAGKNYHDFSSRPLPEIITAEKLLYCKDCQINGDKIELLSTERYTGPSFVMDFGSEVVGFLRVRIKSEKLVSFRVFYGETINEVFSEPPRDSLLHRMLVEEYRLSGGMQEFESRMRVGFRYARIEFFDCEESVEINGFSLRTFLYPVAFKGYFECNDALLNNIWRAGYKTLHLCMQEYYLDAVKRDRFLWVGDAQAEALINYYLFGDTALFEFCWDEMAKCQYPDGSIPSAYGEGLSLIWDYVAWYIIAFYDYYLHTGKKEFLLKHQNVINKATDFLVSKAGSDGLIELPSNPLGVWMVALNNATGVDSFMNSLYLQALQTAIIVSELADDQISSKRYKAIADEISPKVQKLLQESPLEKTPENLRNSTAMTEIVKQKFDKGDDEAALDLIRNSWGAMLKHGADTLYEGFYCENYPPVDIRTDEDELRFTSCCHGWTAGASMLLMTEIAGIKPLTPGFVTFQIKPRVCGLSDIRTIVPTPYGEIALKIQAKDKIKFSIWVPYGLTAIFELGKLKKILSSGRHDIVMERKNSAKFDK